MTTVTRTPVNSVGQMLRRRVEDTPHQRAYTFPVPDAPPGRPAWSSVTWSQVGRHTEEIAAGLVELGVRPGDRVGIASTTRYEWVASAYGIMCSGAATVAVYPTTVSADVHHILYESGTTALFVEDAEQLAKITGLRDDLPSLGTVIVLDSDVPDRTDGWVMTLDELRARGRDHLDQHPQAVKERVDSTGLEDLATLIYTSGTTGRPKGVSLPHRVWVHEVHAIDATVNHGGNATGDESRLLTIDDKQLLWLPLAHVMGKLMVLLPLHIGFETTIDGRIDKIVENIGTSRPTFMGSVPRIFEKAYTGITTMMAENSGPLGIRERLFHWASRVGVEALDTDSLSFRDRLRARVADRLVFAKVRDRFGGRIRYFISGSAALNTDVSRWFWAAGLPILEGYGMTECNVATLGLPNTFRAGTVGAAVDGFEVRIADDGEILVRGPGVMAGYHNNPEETARVLGADGWLHTGDIGSLDGQGRLRITDRKKELFKTSNGKYVAPALMEAKFKGLCPEASQIIVVGEGRRHVAALIALDEAAITAWASREGVPGDYGAITRDPRTREHLQGFIDELNATLNPWERIRTFRVLDRELSVDAQELTPSLKLRRKPVAAHFADDIDALYPTTTSGAHHDH